MTLVSKGLRHYKRLRAYLQYEPSISSLSRILDAIFVLSLVSAQREWQEFMLSACTMGTRGRFLERRIHSILRPCLFPRLKINMQARQRQNQQR